MDPIQCKWRCLSYGPAMEPTVWTPRRRTRDAGSGSASKKRMAPRLRAAMVVASAIFLTDLKGKVLIARNYRGNVSMSAADKFSQRIQSQDDLDAKPVFTEGTVTFMYVKYNNVYLLATARRNCNVALIMLFLYRICDVFKSYFGEITEESAVGHWNGGAREAAL